MLALLMRYLQEYFSVKGNVNTVMDTWLHTYFQLMLDAHITITLVTFSSKIIYKFPLLHFNTHN